MYICELKAAVGTIINENDPCKAFKELELKHWCSVFSVIFANDGQERLPFFLEILSDPECWEEADTLHRIKLNRRLAAKKMVQPYNKAGRPNPLNCLDRYQIACWCCLEEDIAVLFEQIKREEGIINDDMDGLKAFVKKISKSHCSETLTGFWTHIAGGCASDLDLEGMHLYEYGLHYGLFMYRVYVEAVEFFWNRIQSLPEEEVSSPRKQEIFFKTLMRAAGIRVGNYPEICEFCIGQMSIHLYPEILRMDLEEDGRYGTLIALLDRCRFDAVKRLFDYFKPSTFPEDKYVDLLSSLGVDQYPDHYADEAVKLFTYVWEKEGFDKHRMWTLRNELIDSRRRGNLLVPLVSKNYMEPVWAILNEAHPIDLKTFMHSEKADFIRSLLEQRGDLYSVNKFLSYMYATLRVENASTSSMEVDTSSMEMIPEHKRLKKE